MSEWNIIFKPFSELLSNVVDNRGKTCPTAPSGLALIATNCIKNDNLYPVYENVRYISDETYKTWFRGHPLTGDLIFVTKGTPGRVCLVPSKVDFCIAQDMVAIRADNKKVNPKYLFAALRSAEIQGEIENLHVGSLIPHFKKGDFDKLQIPLPERELQEYIGEQYFTFSIKIDLLHRQNKTLEGMAEALWRKMFVEEAKETWITASVKDMINILSGFAFKSSDFVDSGKYRLITIKNVQDGYLDLSKTDYLGVIPEGMPDYCFLQNGDILLSLTGNVGRCCLVNEEDLLLNQRVAKLQARNVRDSAFTYIMFRKKTMRSILEELAKGTAQANLSPVETAKYKIQIPPQDLLENYSAEATPLIKKVLNNFNHIRTLSRLRDTLLPKLMSGEVRMKL